MTALTRRSKEFTDWRFATAPMPTIMNRSATLAIANVMERSRQHCVGFGKSMLLKMLPIAR